MGPDGDEAPGAGLGLCSQDLMCARLGEGEDKDSHLGGAWCPSPRFRVQILVVEIGLTV